MADKEMTKLIRRLEHEFGCDVRRTSHGHYIVRRKGEWICSLPSTGSSKWNQTTIKARLKKHNILI